MSDLKIVNPAPPRDAELVTETRQLTVWWFGWLVQLPTIINALVTALNAYRNGNRKHPVMNSIANTLQPNDIKTLAAWYANQPGCRK